MWLQKRERRTCVRQVRRIPEDGPKQDLQKAQTSLTAVIELYLRRVDDGVQRFAALMREKRLEVEQ